MDTLSERRFLHAQVADIENLIRLADGDPWTTPSLVSKRDEIATRIRALPVMSHVPRATLYFSGGPVSGSKGIDASFAAAVLNEYQEIVKTQYLYMKHGTLGHRGRMPDAPEARLQLSALPRGSFGLELTHADGNDLVATQQVGDVMQKVSEFIHSAAASDAAFESLLPEFTPRALPHLKSFLSVMASARAQVRVVTGDEEIDLNEALVVAAFERLNAVRTEEEDISLSGVFRGATLDSWRFDFRTDAGEAISGRLGPDLNELAVAHMLAYVNRQVTVSLKRTVIRTRSGEPRASYELLDLGGLTPAIVVEQTSV